MKLWIDADAAPGDVKGIVFRAAKRLELPTVLVANQRLQVPPGNAFVTTVRVDGGSDVADRHIVDVAEPGDIAVTADIPLASLPVEKGVRVIDPRGEEYTEENVGERLAVRDFMDSMRGAGVEGTGQSRQMWARIKGETENALRRCPRRGEARRPQSRFPAGGGALNLAVAYMLEESSCRAWIARCYRAAGAGSAAESHAGRGAPVR